MFGSTLEVELIAFDLGVYCCSLFVVMLHEQQHVRFLNALFPQRLAYAAVLDCRLPLKSQTKVAVACRRLSV